jgi:hypothetical protein
MGDGSGNLADKISEDMLKVFFPFGGKKAVEPESDLEQRVASLECEVRELTALLKQTFGGHILFNGKWIPLSVISELVSMKEVQHGE